ncbi:hypothetical protein TanjilG_09730 [Lupinus angustifolius]|uniref:Peptidase S8/S53 domain-containing protein n=1 Tax=Lupinus angustifolius TaxID=3871 RepID=A0A4P1QWH6_LUPAN|nr:PREDICTED: CO(2)-response secreted protease-like [Lupinus angustifolius]OIV96303.1 hypothetical protein TanjilG_09730 [Lupinus angustifolius]
MDSDFGMTQDVQKGKEPSKFRFNSETSMPWPHVSGVASRVKFLNPTWSTSAIKSAIMTSATQTNSVKTPIVTDSGSVATPYVYGTGFLTASGLCR